MTSFYDLDYLIAINEKRLGEHTATHRFLETKFTNLLVIYSAFCIFLVPVVQSLCWNRAVCCWVMYTAFGTFVILLGGSLFYAVKLLLRGRLLYLDDPAVFYRDLQMVYDNGTRSTADIDQLLKVSYILQLETEVRREGDIATDKYSYHHRALVLGLLAALPYLFCVGFQLSLNVKNATMNTGKICTLVEMKVMSKDHKKPARPVRADEIFPGIKTKDVIVLNPPYINLGLFGPAHSGKDKKWIKEREAILAPHK